MALTDEADLVIQGAGAKSKLSLFVLGFVLVLLGAIALLASFTTTLVTVVAAGVLLVLGSLFQTVLTIQSRRGAEVVAHAALAILYAGAGLWLIANPVVGAISITSIIGVFFIAGGILRFASAIYMRSRNWGWAALSGVVAFALGIFTMAYLPEMTGVLIGTLVAIDLIFVGTTLIGYGAVLPDFDQKTELSPVRRTRLANI